MAAFGVITGPWLVLSSIPLPILNWFTAATNFSTNASYMPSWTIILFAQIQVWPELRYFATRAPATARSISASSKIITGALPPNSIEVRLTVSAHCFIKSLPTCVEPVKVTFLTVGFEVISEPTVGASLVGNTLNSPGGKPALFANSTSANAESGVSAAGFSTMAQPTASAGATLRVIIALGKFQGVIAATTPIGCLIAILRRSFVAGMISP